MMPQQTDYQSVHFSRSVPSNSLRPDGLQHARFPCWFYKSFLDAFSLRVICELLFYCMTLPQNYLFLMYFTTL